MFQIWRKDSMKLLRVKEVANKTSVGKSTIWSWVKDGKFPEPIKISDRISVWKESDVDAWIESKIS